MRLTYKHHPFRGLVVHMKTAGTGENAKKPGTGQARRNTPTPSHKKGKLKTLASDNTTTRNPYLGIPQRRGIPPALTVPDRQGKIASFQLQFSDAVIAPDSPNGAALKVTHQSSLPQTLYLNTFSRAILVRSQHHDNSII